MCDLFSLIIALNAGIGGFDADSGKTADFARQRRNDILGCVQSDGNDADFPFAVGDAHASDDIVIRSAISMFSTIILITATLVSIFLTSSNKRCRSPKGAASENTRAYTGLFG